MVRRAHPVPCAVHRSLTLALLGLAGGCVQPFDGSNLQIDFAEGIQTATLPGRVPEPDQPPPNTHYVLYAADLVYRTDAGQVVVDADGRPVVDQTYLFEVTEFAIQPIIDRTSPCLIDLEETRYPGLHVSQIRAKVEEVTGVTDPFAPGVPSADVTDVLNAIRRVDNLEKLEGGLKAVTSHQAFRYPTTAPVGQCPPTAADAMPDPGCRDDASNAQRLRRCRALWAANPDFYEGSDKVFTLPLNGKYLGMVQGRNPLNEGAVGGSSMFVDENLIDHDVYLLNWQYDDLDGNGRPDFPDSIPVGERSASGYPYLQGRPVEITRGVITVPMRHLTNSALRAELAIIPNLGHDDVHF